MSMLDEWRAPDTPATLDARVMASYRKRVALPWWRRMLAAKVEIPVPVLAAGALVLASALWLMRPGVPPAGRAAPVIVEPAVVVTTINADGFQPLPNGAVRLVRKGVRQ
jgi:hypothetical protein